MSGKRARNNIATLSQGNRIFPEDLAGMVGLPKVGDIYYVDAANGNDNNPGNTPEDAFATVSQAHSSATAGQHDVVILISSSSSVSETSVTWSKDYTHLIGGAAPTLNSRARISSSSGSSPFFTVSADGCIFSNIRVGAFEDLNVLFKVTGSRNYFNNVSFQGMGNATAGDDANGRSLVIDGGEENRFYGCTIGLDTIARSAANTELELTGGSKRNTFEECLFTKQADNTGTLFVKSTGTSGLDRWNQFHNCTYYSFWTNDSDKITAAFDISAQTATADIIMSGRQLLIGADDWESSASANLHFEPYTSTTSAIGLGVNNS